MASTNRMQSGAPRPIRVGAGRVDPDAAILQPELDSWITQRKRLPG